MKRERRLFLGLLCGTLAAGLVQDSSTRAASPPQAILGRSDGSVWLWPDALDGAPVVVPGVADALAAELFGSGALLIREDGRLWTWSRDAQPELVRLAAPSRARSIACGLEECLVVTGDDRVLSWRGRAPSPVPGLEDIAAVAVGDRHALALSHTGRVWTWGSNDRGQLGIEGASESARPRPVPGLEGVASIAAGAQHSVAVLADGSVRAWGSNEAGELGAADFADRATPVAVSGMGHAALATAAGGRTFVLTDDGEVWGFGSGEANPSRWTTLGEIAHLRAFGEALIAERSDGSVWAASPAGEVMVPDPSRPEVEPQPPGEAFAGDGPTSPGTAILVVGSDGPSPSDRAVRARLEALGRPVAVLSADQARAETLAGAGVVVISSSVDSRGIDAAALAALRAPIVTWERFLFAPLGLSSTARRPSHGSVRGERLAIVRPGHPIAAGLDGDLSVLQRAEPLNWGLEAPGAEVVAVGPTGLPAVFAYEAGSATALGPAAARRVGLFLPAPREHALTDEGGALFDAAVRWASGREGKAGAGTGEEGGRPDLPEASGTILLVVGNDLLPLPAPDAGYKQELESLGFVVVVKKASAAIAADATGKKMVFVSHTSPNGDVGAKFRSVTVPVAIQAAGILDQMSMTGPLGGTDRGDAGPSTQAVVTTPSHPIAAGLTGTVAVGANAGNQAWGKPSASGVKVLTFPGNTNQGTLFTYEQGAAMVGLSAPERRVQWGFYHPIPSPFTPTGLSLFRRMVLWTTRTEQPPVVSAGPDQSATVDGRIVLSGIAVDDGLPNPPGALTINWSKVSGFGNVAFGTPQSPVTSAVFDNTGEFVLRLTASDGPNTTSDEVTIHVFGEESNDPPVVDAGRDQAVDLASPTATLAGAATDDGLPNPPGALTYSWSRVSGPGTVTFGTPTARTTTATFSARGTHVLRLSASDSELSGYDDVVVTVNAAAVLVVGNTTLSAGDAFMKSRIEALGFPVVVVRAADLTIGHASGRAFVWISSSSPPQAMSDQVLEQFAEVAVPLVVQSEAIVDNLRLTDDLGRGSLTTDRSSITTPTHALAAGLSGTVTLTAPGAHVHAWGTPSAGGVRVASVVGNPAQAIVFGYEMGAVMVEGYVAPERRALFGPKDAAMARLTTGGKRLFDALVFWLTRTNAAPWADAGPDVRTTFGTGVPLQGRVADDGLPMPPGVVTAAWSQVAGPVGATFGNPNAAVTTVSLPEAGSYLFRLTASDGVLSRADTVKVIRLVPGANSPPSASAGPDQTVRLPVSASLRATLGDDGLPSPPGALSVSWTTLSGPGAVTYSAPTSPSTSASFSAPGTYLIRLTASDGALTATDDVQVTAEATANTLMVVGSTAPLNPGDAVAKARLESLGFTVALVDDDFFRTSHADGKALMVVSRTVDSQREPGRYAGVMVPIVSWEPFLLDELVIAGTPNIAVGDAVTIANPGHPLAANLSGTPTIYTSAAQIAWGVPFPQVLKVATVANDAGKGTVLGYEGGASFPDDNVTREQMAVYLLRGSDGPDYFPPTCRGVFGDVPCSSVYAPWIEQLADRHITAGCAAGQYCPASPVTRDTMAVLLLLAREGHEYQPPPCTTPMFNDVPCSNPFARWINELSRRGITAGCGGGNYCPTGRVTRWQMSAFVQATFGRPIATAVPGRRVGLFVEPDKLNGAGLALFDAAVKWATEQPAQSLLVTASTALQAGEAALRDRLVSLGLPPVIVADEVATPAHANGKALVVISGWTDAPTLWSTFRNVQVPVVVGLAYLHYGMGMTGSSPTDYGVAFGTDLEIADSSHPMAAGKRGVQPVATTATWLGWGRPSSAGRSVAQIAGQPGQSAIFGYEPGAFMNWMAAPDRRVGLFTHADTPALLTSAGGALVDAAILWAARSDADRDGLDRLSELRFGTDPANPDTNGDGVLDGAAVRAGISPTNPDMDSDGVTNAIERQRGTDPFRADTDGDGANDGTDCFPLDPTRWQCPAPVPGDVTPPIITLLEPTNAVLISTVPPLWQLPETSSAVPMSRGARIQ